MGKIEIVKVLIAEDFWDCGRLILMDIFKGGFIILIPRLNLDLN